MAAGIALTIAIGAAMVWPALRLPALVLGLLAIPGNVDNYVPQMRMDPHLVANNTGPAISVIDLLILWAVILTIREGRRPWRMLRERQVLLGALGFGVIATAAAVAVIFTRGVEPLASLRGILTMLRIPAICYLAVALLPLDRQGLRVSFAAALGVISLIGNGLYTSAIESHDRFTAATFGRNGLGVVLVVSALLAGGAAIQTLRGEADRRIAPLFVLIGFAALFGAVATGTRMTLVALVIGVVGAIILNRTWLTLTRAIMVAGGIAAIVTVVFIATLATSAGARTVSPVTDVGGTINPDTDPEMRTRSEFWTVALKMVADEPMTGVGPYQWNVLRYRYDSTTFIAVANPHNTYIQLAAELGIPTAVAYLLLLLAVAGFVVTTQLRRRSTTGLSWSAAALVACAAAYPVTELTNSHLFNVRIGAFGWVLLGTALAMALADLRERPAVVELTNHR